MIVFRYWDWGLYVSSPQTSPIFDGSPSSMGSNSVYIPRTPNPLDWHSYGTGGGCAYSGPFTNMTVNLGPINLHNTTGLPPVYPVPSKFDYNPRCLKQDVNPFASNYAATLDLILSYTNIALFHENLPSWAIYPPLSSILSQHI